jgi:hypothetical protein
VVVVVDRDIGPLGHDPGGDRQARCLVVAVPLHQAPDGGEDEHADHEDEDECENALEGHEPIGEHEGGNWICHVFCILLR